jgi:hypothetical protein
MAQDDINMLVNGNSFYKSGTGNGLSAFNYRSEPFAYRFGTFMNGAMGSNAPANWEDLSQTDLVNIGNFQYSSIDTTLAASDTLVAADPQTPVFRAPGGMPVRFRLVDPGGIGDNQQVFELTGHVWEEEPFQQNSMVLGHNPLSQHSGTTAAYGPTSHYNILIDSAGGADKIPGDYRYRSWTANQYQVGMWGLFRVGPLTCSPQCPDTVTISSVQESGSKFVVQGVLTVSPQTRAFANSVTIHYGDQSGEASVNSTDGTWTFIGPGSIPATLTAVSKNAGEAVYSSYRTESPVVPKSVQAKPKEKRKFTRR